MTSSPKSDVRPRKAETTHRYDTPQPIDSRRLERANNALHAKLKPQETVKPKRTFASYMDDEWAHYVDLNWKASRTSRKAALCGVIFGHALMR